LHITFGGACDSRSASLTRDGPTFEQHRSASYDRLQAVRERGELREWLLFFLTGVADSPTTRSVAPSDSSTSRELPPAVEW